MKQTLVVVIALLTFPDAPSIPPSSSPSTSSPPPSSPPSQDATAACVPLVLAQQYEKLGMWERAEEHYFKADACNDLAARHELLQGVARVRRQLPSPRPNASLRLAKEYEDLGQWVQAEGQYAEAAKAGDQATIDQAAVGIRRARAALESEHWWRFDWWAGVLGRVLGVLLVAAALWTAGVAATRRWKSISVKIGVSDEVAAQRMAFWFSHAGAMLRAHAGSGDLDLSHPPFSSGLPYILLPNLPDPKLEMGEIELGGVKLSMSNLVGLAEPRVQVFAGWTTSPKSSRAYAEIAARSWPRFRTKRVVSRPIAMSDESPDDDALELLAYDVIIQAVDAYAS